MTRLASDIFHAEVEKLSYQFWEERGKPAGSPEETGFVLKQSCGIILDYRPRFRLSCQRSSHIHR